MTSRTTRLLLIAVLSSLIFAQPGMAREFADIYTDCGLGALIAPRNDAVAAVTNVTWDLGTTAISSNASCPDSCQGGQQRSAAFIHQSYPSLEKDLARGSGKYLDTLFALSGAAPEDQPALAEALRSEFTNAVADASYTEQTRFEQAQVLYNLLYKLVETEF
ncbi:MAG: DUF3015 family protein [bacterium]|nr:DUF3015 family protein [bacterium]